MTQAAARTARTRTRQALRWMLSAFFVAALPFLGFLPARLQLVTPIFAYVCFAADLFLFIFFVIQSRRAGYLFVFAFVFLVCLTITDSFIMPAIDIPHIFLLINKSRYLGEIGKSDQSFAVFPFHEGKAREYIIYDADDQILLPAGKRSSSWEALHGKSVGADSSTCEIKRRQLPDHFYYVVLRC